MKQEAAIIIFSVIFIVMFGLYLSLGIVEDAPVRETATVVDALDEPIENSAEDADAASLQQAPEDEQDIAKSIEVDTSLLDSFDQQDIEGEFEDVQIGIDLLNNPLQ